MKPLSCSTIHSILTTIPHNHHTNNDLSTTFSLDITLGSGELILDDGEEVRDMTSQLDLLLPLVCADVPMVVNKAIASSLSASEDTCAHNGVAPVSNDDIPSQVSDMSALNCIFLYVWGLIGH